MSLSIKLLIGVALVAALGLVVQLVRYDGARSYQNQIERQNNDAGSNAESHRLSYDACRDAGRVWNFETGKCGRVAPGGGY